MALALITPPADEPVTLAEVKEELRTNSSDEDSRLHRLIIEARQSIDGGHAWLGRALMLQTWELIYDAFPFGAMRLPLAPVQEIVSITYDDPDGVEQTVAPADYYLDKASEPPWLVACVAGWPAGTLQTVNAVRVRFIAGYPDAANVPGPIKRAIRLMVVDAVDKTDHSEEIAELLAKYRVFL